MRTLPHPNRHQERGTAAVELAIVAPLMLIMAFGFLEIGRMLFDYQAISSGVRGAARYLGRVPIKCDAGGPIDHTIGDGEPWATALNIAYTGKSNPAGPADSLVSYWDGTDPQQLKVTVECIDTFYFLECPPCESAIPGRCPDALRMRPLCSRVTVKAAAPFTPFTGLNLGIGANITLHAEHTEVNFGG